MSIPQSDYDPRSPLSQSDHFGNALLNAPLAAASEGAPQRGSAQGRDAPLAPLLAQPANNPRVRRERRSLAAPAAQSAAAPAAAGGPEALGDALNMAAAGVEGVQSDLALIGRASFENQLAEWRAEGRYWMDPNIDVEPDLDYFMSQMPSAAEGVNQGSMFKGGKGGYIGENVASGALSGAAMGTSINAGWGTLIGAGVGAVVGLLKGALVYSSAEDEDRSNAKKASKQFRKAQEMYQQRRKNRAMASNRQYDLARREHSLSMLERGKAEKETEKNKKVAAVAARRAQLMNLFSDLEARSRR